MLPGIGVFIGKGTVVKVLVPYLKAKGFKVDSLWAQTLETAQSVARELDIPFYTNRVDDVLLRKEVDLVIIMCPPILHAQIAVKALGIGKHVLCDKPGGLSQGETLKMVHASQYYPSLISVIAYSLRYLPSFQFLKNAVRDNYVGEVRLCDIHMKMGSLIGKVYDWTAEEGMGGGVLYTVGSHIIDVTSAIIGQRAVRVHGLTRTCVSETQGIRGIRSITSDDFCTFQMEMSKGALVVVTLNSQVDHDNFDISCIVSGSTGYLNYTSGSQGGQVTGRTRNGLAPDLFHTDTDELAFLPSSIVNSAPIQPHQRPYINGLFRMISALRDAFCRVEDRSGWVKEAVSMAATFEDAQYVMAVMEAVLRSSKSREWTRVDIWTEEPDPNPALSAAVRRSNIAAV